MTGIRKALRTAAWMLAVGLLVADAQAIDLNAPENSLRTAWSPSREDAVVVENVQAASDADPIPADSALSRSLLMRRPPGLSRPAPARSRTSWTAAPSPTESLPSVTGAPTSPEGLPVPAEGMMYEGTGPWMAGGDCCGPCYPN